MISHKSVIPAKAGIQRLFLALQPMVARIREDDGKFVSAFPMITASV